MEKNYSPFWVALATSFIVAICSYFVLFFVLRVDIVDTKSTVMNLILEQDKLLRKTFDTHLSVMQNALIDSLLTVEQSVVSIVATKSIQPYLINAGKEIGSIEKKVITGGGSGIIVSKSGYILTNKHVVADLDIAYTIITHDNKAYSVKNIWVDPILDIALLLVMDPTTLSEHSQVAGFIGIDDSLSVGQFVFAIGNAFTRLQNTVTFGIVSATNRQLQMQGNNLYIGLLQTDASINPGNSGGPLVDVYGNVIAINTAIDQSAQGIGFALPVTQDFVNATIASVVAHAAIVRPFIGIVYMDITPSTIEKLNISVIDHGIYVTDIITDSPASLAGLLAGDIVYAINDVVIDKDIPFLYQLYTYMPGDSIRLSLLRSGDRMSFDVVLGKNNE